MGLIDNAAKNDDYESAGKLIKVATHVVRKLKAPQLNRDLLARSRDLDRMKAKFAAVQQALGVLADNPGDAEANLAAGQWYCLTKGNWEKGLPLLAKGANKELADLANRDLAQPSVAQNRWNWPTHGGHWQRKNRPRPGPYCRNAQSAGTNARCPASQDWRRCESRSSWRTWRSRRLLRRE